MTKDEYKNIEIHYNHLNLPDTIIAHGQGKIINVYLADGSLLKRKVIVFEDEGGKVVEVEKDSLDYQGEFLFQQDTLSKIITEEGYASPSKSNKKKLTYFYVVSDHLGHSRVVLDEKENVVQTTAYYPYGLPITDLSSETKYKYLYTGKEFIGEFGLNWYDHHARQYDAEIGRWSAIDPSLQAASPYMAMGNNPMMYVDTDGRTWGIFKPFVKAWDYAWGKANQFARWADQSGVPSAGVGYNTAQGTYHYMGNSGNVYHNQYGNNYEGKVDQAVFDARGDYFSQQTNNASYNQMVMSNIMPVASNGGGGYFVRDATYMAPQINISVKHTAPDMQGELGVFATVYGTMKKNKYSPVVSWTLTGVSAYGNIKNKNYPNAVWNVIEGAGGIYSIVFKGAYNASQSNYVQNEVGRGAYADYMKHVRIYQLTGSKFHLEQSEKAARTMRRSRYNLLRKK